MLPDDRIAETGEIKEKSSNCFEWEIQDYFSLSQKADVSYTSPVLEFADATWYFKICPNGEREDNSIGWVHLCLCMKEAEWSERSIKIVLSIKDKDGEEHIGKVFCKQISHPYEDCCDWNRVVKRAKLVSERWKVAPNGILTISCTFNCDCASESSQQTPALASVDKIIEDFKNLLLSEYDCDVTLKVKDRDFRAHKLILGARSPVFSSMFKHDTVEKSRGIVDITDCDPDSFQIFLLYLYSGKVDKMNSCNVLSLYSVADKYSVDYLKTECLQFMESELSVDTFGDVIALAVLYNESSLIEIATAFFTKHIKEIIVTVKWQSFIIENPIAANELHIKALNSIMSM